MVEQGTVVMHQQPRQTHAPRREDDNRPAKFTPFSDAQWPLLRQRNSARVGSVKFAGYPHACSSTPLHGDFLQEEQLGPQTVAPLPGAPPVELPAIPTEFPPLPDVKLPDIEQV